MGYEVLYKYYPRKDGGVGYDTEKPQEFTKQLGKTEELPLEKLAQAIMLQLARRDVMVFDVAVKEFVKRDITFKECKGGILLKNKKFLFDGSVEAAVEEIPEAPEPAPEPVQKPVQNNPPPPNHTRVLRYEVYDPDPMIMPSLMKRYRLTPKKKYGILEEKASEQKINVNGSLTTAIGYEYILKDDEGHLIRISGAHFVPPQIGLIGMAPATQMDMPLSYPGVQGNLHDMPVLR